MTVVRGNSPGLAIIFIVLAMTCISINDMLIKLLSGSYPLHQIVFLRSAIGMFFSLAVLQFEGGFGLLRTDRIWLHLLRGLCIVGANMAFFAAIAVTPLADATALFFVAPLFITILAVPYLDREITDAENLDESTISHQLHSGICRLYGRHVQGHCP